MGLCLNQTSEVKLEVSGLWAGAQISVGQTVIHSFDGGDSLPFPDRRRMSKVCVEGGCVYYHRYCEEMQAELNCTITYNQVWWDHNRQIVVRSLASDVIDADLQSIGLVLSPGVMIPLDNLSNLADTQIPPHCRPASDTGCS